MGEPGGSVYQARRTGVALNTKRSLTAVQPQADVPGLSFPLRPPSSEVSLVISCLKFPLRVKPNF